MNLPPREQLDAPFVAIVKVADHGAWSFMAIDAQGNAWVTDYSPHQFYNRAGEVIRWKRIADAERSVFLS